MATNPPSGDGHRNGAVKGRSQTKTPAGNYVKRDTKTGRFLLSEKPLMPLRCFRASIVQNPAVIAFDGAIPLFAVLLALSNTASN